LLLGGLGEAWLAAAGLEHRNPIPNVVYGQPGAAAADLLRRDGPDGRFRTLSIATPEYVHGETPAIEERYSSLSELALDNLLVAMKWNDALWPNVPLVYGLSSADGYDGGVLPLERYVAFTGAMLGSERVRPDGVLASRLDALPEPRWLDLMGVRYVVAGKAKDASRDVFYLDRAISVALGPGERLELGALPLGEFTRLMLLSSYTGPAPAGPEIGRLELHVGDGRVTSIPLRDDRETAAATAEGPGGEALERVEPWSPRDADQPADWLAEIPFDRQPIAQLAIVNAAPNATLHVRSLNLVDDVRQAAFSITLDERIERTEFFDQKLYDRRNALPRAYVVVDLRVADDAEALRALADPAFDPRRTVLVAPDGNLRDVAIPGDRPGAVADPARPPGAGAVTFEQAGAERVRLLVRADAPGYLVLSDTWFPGWQASIDGERVPILRANVLFRAVPVAAGEQVVEFRYEPRSFQIGALMSVVTLILGLLLLVGARRLRRRRLRADRRLSYGEPMVGPGHANGAVEPRALHDRVDGHADGAASDATNLAPHLVALLFAADEPLTVADAARILGARKRQVEQAVELLTDSPPVGLIVQRDGDRLQLATGPASAPYVRRLRGLEEQARLSRAALEVLAVVAYRQPITRAEIEAVRGVGGDRALATLLQRGLVEEVGRKETIGRPVLFGTTLAFLEHLGLRSLADLPPMPGAEQSAAGA
ncbi:MAG: SMC-Scp complex subunit ScpB, partial [Chloroflexota bacterium]|nr:SMC-Scp complex subunit ScpB [Chloroflexota bacterium]